MIIEQPSFYLRWLYKEAVWRINPEERAVYLTFDDGPIPEATPFTLDVLDRFNAKATFFMVGENADKYPHLLQEVRSRGHRIGNHTYNHIGGLFCPSWRFVANTEKANEVLHTDLFRAPRGWMKPLQYQRIRRKYKIVMWDLVTRDYSTLLNGEDVLNNVKRYTRPGSIITFHDSLRSIDKLKHALPAALQWLSEQGYEFRVIP
ncbi:MAG: polysaccharide deacetylase family protein [Bacteroidaceae bacterium]|nr:polysaccharide deacetylase family protein [Bacteroidaceae bacterium]